MKWFSLLLSFFLGKLNVVRAPSLKQTINVLFEEAAYRSRKPTIYVLAGLTFVLILSGGFFMGLIDITTQYDRDGVVQATASSITGFSLVALSLIGFIWVFTRAWPGVKAVKKKEEKVAAEQNSGIEQALILLVMDFIKEREFKREERRHQAPIPPSPDETPQSTYQH